jgi:hypothetical protein
VTAADASGNSSTCTFKVIVKDTTPPAVTLSLGGQSSKSTSDGVRDEQILYDTSQSVPVYYTVSDTCDPAPTVKVELFNNRDNPVDIKSSSPIMINLKQYAGKNTITLTAIDASGNITKASVDFEVALKLEEGQISIRPEILRVHPGTFTVSLSFPSPYDAATVYDVTADGAPHKAIVFSPATQKVICDFLRADISMKPLDQTFEVSGYFMYKDTSCKFFGSDTIRKVRRPDKTNQPLISGQTLRNRQPMRP